MGGPTEQETNTVFIPPGEGRQTFSPLPLGWLVENLEVGADGILESVVGPSILRIKSQIFVTELTGFEGAEKPIEGSTTDIGITSSVDGDPRVGFKTGEPFSVFSASLLRGSVNVLLYRIGSRMYFWRGDQATADEVLLSGLTVNPESANLDQYVVIEDQIIYTNGIDAPQVITYDGSATPLGFARRAGSPSVSSPGQPDYDEAPNYYPNSMGYTWKGRIGTPGDELAGQKASLLQGSWYYYFQYEDINGNLSEFSIPSDPATLHTNQADPFYPVGSTVVGSDDDGPLHNISVDGVSKSARDLPMGTEIDDLTRRFLVSSPGELPEHAVATRIFRSADTRHKESTPRFLDRVPGTRQFYYDDNHADSDLGPEWTETVAVPVFRVACAHQGRLVIGNVPGSPGIVRRSQPGFAGTFNKFEYIYPDSNGAAVTALASHNGNLVAFTENSTYLIGDDFAKPRPLSSGVGCVASKSIQSLRDGSLVWLARDGFYSLKLDGSLVKISTSIDKVFTQELSSSQLFRAASVIDTHTGEYRCAVAGTGFSRNNIILCFDGLYWRRQTLGIFIADMCSLADHTRTTVAVGADPREINATLSVAHTLDPPVAPFNGKVSFSRIFVLDRQSTDYFGPPRRIRYRSAWLRSSNLGLVPTNVRSLYIGMLDSWVGNATVRLYRNGSWEPIAVMHDVLLHGPDDGSGIIADVAANAVIGEARTRDPRVFWRQIPVDIQNANSWAFEIELVGSPSPVAPTTRTVMSKDEIGWRYLFRDSDEARQELEKRIVLSGSDESDFSWELGRLSIAAFAFDTSIATKGAPLGRVPFRQDK